MNELKLLKRIEAKLPRARGRGLVLGIGDDCAVFRPGGAREDLIFTTDMTIEGVHFLPGAHPPGAVGWRTLARGLSDIAAMGGEPRFCLLSLALAPWTDERWLDGFLRGFLRLASRSGTDLAGGDLSRADRVMCDIVVCGAVPRGAELRRDGARPGDAIYVSGRLGGAALGLQTRRGNAWRRHLRPEPRLDLGRFLRRRAGACMDLSDGLSLDLHRLCLAAGVAAELEQEAIPSYPGATLEHVLHGGEDYELLFTARGAIPARHAGVPLTRIGVIAKGRAGEVRLAGRRLKPRGWDPFPN